MEYIFATKYSISHPLSGFSLSPHPILIITFQATPPGFLLRFLYARTKNAIYKETKTKSTSFLANAGFVAAAKKAAVGVPYVSTNDVLTSAFCNALRCDVAMMAFNYRGRVEGLEEGGGEDQVGNYGDLICYTPADYGTPEDIRKSVASPPYTRAGGGRMPSNVEHLTATYGGVTNWAAFAKPLEVDGGKQDLHLPLFDWNAAIPASICGLMVIFTPREGEVGVLCAGSTEALERINASGMVGGKLGAEM